MVRRIPQSSMRLAAFIFLHRPKASFDVPEGARAGGDLAVCKAGGVRAALTFKLPPNSLSSEGLEGRADWQLARVPTR